jgi:hypothetical protein
VLDGMLPAFAPRLRASTQPVKRLGVVYVPNGMNMAQWTPVGDGLDFEFSRILEPLAPFRNNILVLSGLDNAEADGRPGEGGGDHSRSQAAFLTGVHARKTEGADIRNAMSMDQIVARQFGQETQLASLELGLEMNEIAGAGEDGYSAAYSGALAWRSPSDPLPVEADPRAVFERLFGASESTDRSSLLRRIQKDRSILDSVSAELSRLNRGLGPRDRTKLTEYLDSVRDVERIQRAEEQSGRELPQIGRPAGVPGTFEEHAKLMFDLMALAFQTDLTRVSTFPVGREKSGRAYPEAGVPDSHHAVSHHQNRQDQLEKVARINAFHMRMFAYFLGKLQSIPEGGSSLLDSSVIVYGAGMADSDSHYHHNVPILLAGGGAGSIIGGRHLRVEKGTPLTNLHLTLLDRVGVAMDGLGDSTGKLELISTL